VASALDDGELQQRIQAANSDDTVRGMIFNGTLDTLRSSAGGAAVDAVLSQLKKPKWVDLFNYGVADYLRLAWLCAEALSPKVGDREKGFYLLGSSAASSFLGSAIGKTLKTLAANEPRRLLTNLPTSYKLATSFGERRMQFQGLGHALFSMNRDFLPVSFHEGTVHAALVTVGGQNVVVKGHPTALLDSDYEIQWDEASR